MADSILRTFVHVSDLHFGAIDMKNGDALLDASAQKWWRTHKLLDGFLGHAHASAVHLMQFFVPLHQSDGARLIVTGDLTAVGAPGEFVLGRTFLESAIAIQRGVQVGLMVLGGGSVRSQGQRVREVGPSGEDADPAVRSVGGRQVSLNTS